MEQVNTIKKKAISGAVWKFLERMAAQLVSFVVTVVLARLLDPGDYSVVSIVSIFFSFANVFISGGFNTALIQKGNADEEDYSSVLFLSVTMSALIYGLLFLAAPGVARLYEKAELVLVIRVMGLILPVNAVKSVVCAHVSSHLQFRKFFYATIGGTLVSAVIGIAMAATGWGSWALVAQQMSNTIIDTVILCLTTKMPLVARISGKKLKGLFRYGWKIFASSLLAVLYTEINPLFIGLRYSGTDLALYSKGRNFPTMLSSVCNNTLSAVLFPVLAKFQDSREDLLRCTRRFMRVASFVIFPAMLGLFSVADNFVLLLLTEKWMPAAKYIRIFCVGELFVSVNSGNCEAVKAQGRSDIFLKMEIVKKIGYFLIIGVAMLVTDTPVALAYSSIACTALAVLVNCTPNISLMGYGVKQQLQDILPNLLCAVIMCAAVQLVQLSAMPLALELVVQILVGAATYVAAALLTRNENLRYIWAQIKGQKTHA